MLNVEVLSIASRKFYEITQITLSRAIRFDHRRYSYYHISIRKQLFQICIRYAIDDRTKPYHFDFEVLIMALTASFDSVTVTNCVSASSHTCKMETI